MTSSLNLCLFSNLIVGGGGANTDVCSRAADTLMPPLVIFLFLIYTM